MMSAKKTKKVEIPETITLTPEVMKLPLAKQFLKQIEAAKEKAELETKLAPVVEAASKALGQDFTSFKQVVRYVAKLTGDNVVAGKRGLTDEQKDRVKALTKEGKKPKDIATELGCKPSQVSAFIFNSKS